VRIRSTRQTARRPPGAEDLHGWRESRWLAIPDAISQLEQLDRQQLDRQLLTRRDIERLFGVGKVRAAALMQTFGPNSSAPEDPDIRGGFGVPSPRGRRDFAA